MIQREELEQILQFVASRWVDTARDPKEREKLEDAANNSDPLTIIDLLQKVVPEFKRQPDIK